MPRSKRWHPSQESDELVYAVCDRFLLQLAKQYDAEDNESERRGAAAAVAQWLRTEWHRDDLSRERVYPLFWEAVRRNFLFLQPPREQHLARMIAERYELAGDGEHDPVIQVVNARGSDASRHITAAGADLVHELIRKLGEKREGPVHIGLGAGYSAMMVAKRLAHRVYSDLKCPGLVLHALSAGGFRVDEAHKSPITYFSYFDDALPAVECVGLYSEAAVRNEDYQRVKRSPGVNRSFERAEEIDIVITSFASEKDEHGMLNQFLANLIAEGELEPNVLEKMRRAGWVGDVQFRPYSPQGPIVEECPVRAVTLFELSDLVERAKRPDTYVVLLAGPCGECGRAKTEALVPLLSQPNLRLWTHLVTDVQTARELLEEK